MGQPLAVGRRRGGDDDRPSIDGGGEAGREEGARRVGDGDDDVAAAGKGRDRLVAFEQRGQVGERHGAGSPRRL